LKNYPARAETITIFSRA